MRRRARRAGFTLIEVLVALAFAVIGLLGVVGLQTTTTKGNRLARDLDRARAYAGQLMEDLRARPTAALAAGGSLPDVVTPDGATFTLGYTLSGVTGSTTLVRITATVSFVDLGDGTLHETSAQILRTTEERL